MQELLLHLYDAASEFYQDFLFNEELMLYSADNHNHKDTHIVPDEIDVEKVWLLEEGIAEVLKR